ncbi:MAG: response regulator, partial [Defluviitaleaceae bacterium]|nr:response regulator [Defluviitaleaceae bacterium]
KKTLFAWLACSAFCLASSISVESAIGKGSVFSFTVRLARGEEEKDGYLRKGLEPSGIRVLAVDGDPEVLSFFEEASKRIGFKCQTASSGLDAFALIARSGPSDVYFVNWEMPEMDGIAFAKSMNAGSVRHQVVLMISATDWGLVQESAETAGIRMFIQKPLFVTSIAEIVSECLSAPGGRETDEPAGRESNYSGKTILLADDVEVNREIIQAMLEPTKIGIDCAANGALAAEKYLSDPGKYVMIFMDLQMPEMDGFEATRKIRESGAKGAAEIPIVAMTANVFKDDIEKCFEAGMNDHVGKPVDFGELVGVLEKYLS